MMRRCYAAICAASFGLFIALGAAAQGTITYKYDDQGRLVSSRYPNGATTTYTYDAVDNRTRLTMSFTNQAPIAADDAADVFISTTKDIYVLLNDSDPNNDALTITAAGTATKGATAIASGGRIQYTADPATSGADSFTYTISDGTATATGTVRVNINAQAPTASNSSFTVTANSTNNAATLSLGGGTPTTVFVEQQALNGSAYASGTTILYTPKAGFQGTDRFTYSASNSGGRSAAATATVTVGTAPAAPTVSASTMSVTRNAPKTDPLTVSGNYTSLSITTAPSVALGQVTLNGRYATFTPVVGQSGSTTFAFQANGPGGSSSPATVTVNVAAATGSPPAASNTTITTTKNTVGSATLPVTGSYSQINYSGGPTHGSVVISGANATYTPVTDYTGGDSFTYVAAGAGGESSAATVTITVNAPSLALPTAANSSATVGYNSTNNIIPLSLGGGAASGMTIVTGPSTGTLSVTGTQIKYTPTAGQSAADSFVYKATNATGQSSNATVSLTVNSASVVAPTVASNYATVGYGSAANTMPLTFGGGAPTAAQITREPSHGTRTIEGAVIRYTPTSGYYGPDSFDYTASNAGGVSGSATIGITVSPPAPSVHADGMSVPYETPSAKSLPVTGPYTSLQAVTSPVHGSVSFSGNSVTFTPAASYSGTDFFTYRAVGPGGTGSAERVDVIVGLPASSNNVAPNAASNSIQVQTTELAVNVLANDSDPDGDALTIISLSSYNTGWASYRIDGPNIYVKSGSVNATDYITYTVSDGRGGVATATLTSFLKPN